MRFFFFFLRSMAVVAFSVGLVHCLLNQQIFFSTKILLKIVHTALFTHLKIILLQYFQFLAKYTVSKHVIPCETRLYHNRRRKLKFWGPSICRQTDIERTQTNALSHRLDKATASVIIE